MRVSVQLDDFDIGQELGLFRNGKSNTGAIVSFQGIVRNNRENSLLNMDIEQYPVSYTHLTLPTIYSV